MYGSEGHEIGKIEFYIIGNVSIDRLEQKQGTIMRIRFLT